MSITGFNLKIFTQKLIYRLSLRGRLHNNQILSHYSSIPPLFSVWLEKTPPACPIKGFSSNQTYPNFLTGFMSLIRYESDRFCQVNPSLGCPVYPERPNRDCFTSFAMTSEGPARNDEIVLFQRLSTGGVLRKSLNVLYM